MKIVLEDLTKRFPNRNKKQGGFVTAVDHFTLEIPDGKLVGLLGPSGCGKSTTLNLISGIEKATEGKIFFGDEDVTDIPPELRGVGLVFQSYALYPHLNVFKNIRFPLENLRGEKKLSPEEMEKRVYEAARLVQIDSYMERKPKELSGGQQQRVAIARALVKAPKVLLLDEPLSNLDARLRLQTREELRRIQQNTKITTVFVTHDQEEAMSISDIIVVMKDGVIHQVGAPQDVYDDPANRFVAEFLGTPPINVIKGCIKGDSLYIGEDLIFKISNVIYEDNASGGDNVPVMVGIRPEGFIPDRNGVLSLDLSRYEVMGRDVSCVCSHPDMESKNIRAIIDAKEKGDAKENKIRFSLKKDKVFLFDQNTGARIRFKVKD